MSSALFYKWRSRYGGIDASMMARLKEFEEENSRLNQKKALVVDAKRSRLYVYENHNGQLKFETDYYVSQDYLANAAVRNDFNMAGFPKPALPQAAPDGGFRRWHASYKCLNRLP